MINSSHESALEVDVCIIGSGPAAISVALRLAGTGRRVVILCGGEKRESPADRDLYRGIVSSDSSHEPLEENRRRQFGGTSVVWGGRCIPFDEVDFSDRRWIPDSGWPLTRSTLEKHLARATTLCEAGSAIYDVRQMGGLPREIIPSFDDQTIVSWPLERWSMPTDFGKRYRKDLEAADNIQILWGCHATSLRLSRAGSSVSAVDAVYRDGTSVKITARRVVLACGGLENARLLLASRGVAQNGVGNHNDCVGRYYMSHLFGTSAVVRLEDPARMIYELEKDAEGVYFRRRFWVTPEEQERRKIGNGILFFFRPQSGSALHRDSLFSAAYLTKYAARVLGRPSAGAVRQMFGDDRKALGEHLFAVGRDVPVLIPRAISIFKSRFLQRRRLPFVLPPSSSNQFHVFFQTEHHPNPASRVVLSDAVDRHGMPRLEVRIAFSELDIHTAMETNRVFAERMRLSGLGKIDLDEESLRSSIETCRHSFNSNAHQVGTTRMSADPAHGVVNADCRVHGVDNLYLAGSSVFPTSGHANPTLMLVALADRLGEHLANE